MKAKVDGVSVSSERPFMLYSRSWGKLGEFYTLGHAETYMQAGLTAPAPIAKGQMIREATLYMWRDGDWKPIKKYRAEVK